MEPIKRKTLFFQEGTSDKIYEVDLCQVDNGYFVNFRYGRRGATLKEGTKTTQAVSLAQAEKIFEKLVAEKTRKGYCEVVQSPESASPKPLEGEEGRKQVILRRLLARDERNWPLERAIWRAGELKLREAVPALVSLLGSGSALRDYCLAAALGWCGDDSAIADVQHLYETPATPEFVKRIAWEARWKLENEAERRRMQEAKIAELPEGVQELARNGSAEALSSAVQSHLKRVVEIPPAVKEFQTWVVQNFNWNLLNDAAFKERVNSRIERLPEGWSERIPKLDTNLYRHWSPYYIDSEINNYIRAEKTKSFVILDTLYQIDNESTRPYVLEVVGSASLQDTYYFQRLRHIFKMAEYRQDLEVFSLLAYRFDKEPQGYYRSYSYKTRQYLRKRVWRTLRKLGEEGDSLYATIAAAILLQYSDSDAQAPKQTTFSRWDYTTGQIQNFQGSWDAFAAYSNPKLFEVFFGR